MNGLQVFANEQFGAVRIIEDNGKVLFCGADVAKALGYARPTKAVMDHCKGVLKRDILTNGGEQEMTVIPEGDVYRLIVHSRLPKAQEFEVWVFDTVLPEIRKTGGYIAGEERMDDDQLMAQALIVASRKLEQRTAQLEEANRQIEADRPKVLFADAVAAADTSILVGEMAKILTQNGVKDMGQNRFFAWLRDNGYLMKSGSSKNMPTQFSCEKGLFEIKESTKVDANGSVRVMKTPKVTGAGQQYFVNLFLGKTEALV